jgi:hypothetical protein
MQAHEEFLNNNSWSSLAPEAGRSLAPKASVFKRRLIPSQQRHIDAPTKIPTQRMQTHKKMRGMHRVNTTEMTETSVGQTEVRLKPM